jgi:hypothetical protein
MRVVFAVVHGNSWMGSPTLRSVVIERWNWYGSHNRPDRIAPVYLAEPRFDGGLQVQRFGG